MFLNFYSYKIHFFAYFFFNLFLLKYGGGGGLVSKSCATLVTPWTIACQAPLSMGVSRQEEWSGIPATLCRYPQSVCVVIFLSASVCCTFLQV